MYTFVDGIEAALASAKAAAEDQDVSVMGGADIAQLFGSGTRLFERLGSEHFQFETAEVIETAAATHLRFRVVK